MTIARIFTAVACAFGIALSQRIILLIAFLLCVALNATLIVAAVWGFVTGEYVGGQVYIVILTTGLCAAGWGHMLMSERTSIETEQTENCEDLSQNASPSV